MTVVVLLITLEAALEVEDDARGGQNREGAVQLNICQAGFGVERTHIIEDIVAVVGDVEYPDKEPAPSSLRSERLVETQVGSLIVSETQGVAICREVRLAAAGGKKRRLRQTGSEGKPAAHAPCLVQT